MDVAANMTVIWLNFKFTDNWFRRLGCNYFMRFVFPLLKTCALAGNLESICCNCCCCRTTACGPPEGMEQTVNVSDRSPTVNSIQEEKSSDDENDVITERDNNDTQFPYDGGKDEEENGGKEHEHCFTFCCNQQSKNLYCLSIQEYHLYILDKDNEER